MKVLENLECVEVSYSADKKKAILTFFDPEACQIREVSYNKQSYDSTAKKYVDDPKKEESAEKMIAADLGLTFNTLDQAYGSRHDIYCYDNFNSLHPVATFDKFDESMAGEILQTEIKDIVVDDVAIWIHYDYEGRSYRTPMRYAKWMEAMHQYVLNPIEKEKKIKQFEDKFLVPIEKKDELIGHPIMVEVRKSFNSYWGDIKKFPRKK